MVRIRLTRVGLKKQPSYRIIVNDIEKQRDSRYLENIGFYNPRTQPETVQLKEDRVMYWLSVGAQPSDSVKQLLRKKGTLERFERFKKGEDLEALLAEAAEQDNVAEISPKTRYPAPEKSASNLNDDIAAAEEEVEADATEEAADPEAEEAPEETEA